jgi:hypothetical protein
MPITGRKSTNMKLATSGDIILRNSKTIVASTIFSLFALSAAGAAQAHTKLISGEPTGTFRAITLAVTSGYEPVGTGNQWHSYFSAVPANTGIFTINDNDPLSDGSYGLFSWFDTNGTPSSYNSGSGGLLVATAYTGYSMPDTVYELTEKGKIWYDTPVGPGSSWGSFTNLPTTAVPGFVSTGQISMAINSVGAGDGAPWVVNGNDGCGGGNSSIYNTGEYGSTWVNTSGCGYYIAESEDCLFLSSYDVSGNTYLWTSPTTGTTPWIPSWTKRALLLSTGGNVTSMSVNDDSLSSEKAYFTDGNGDLKEWSGSCSTTGSVTTLITANGSTTFVTAVSVDHEAWVHGGSENLYYINGNSGLMKQELWLY